MSVGLRPQAISAYSEKARIDLTESHVLKALSSMGDIRTLSVKVRYHVRSTATNVFTRFIYSLLRRIGCPLKELRTRTIEVLTQNQLNPNTSSTSITKRVVHSDEHGEDLEATYDTASNSVIVTSRIPNIVGEVTVTDVAFKREAKSYTPQSPEVAAFVASIHRSRPIQDSYTKEDLEFIQNEIAPRLLSARDALIQSLDDPSLQRQDINLPFSASSTKGCSYLQIDASSLPHSSYFRRYQTLPISVKVYPCGKVRFHLPCDKPKGAYKQARLTIFSDKSTPSTFYNQIKLSLRKDKITVGSPAKKRQALYKEMMFPLQIGHPNVGVIPSLLIEPKEKSAIAPSEIQAAYVEEAISLSKIGRDPSIALSAKDILLLMQNTFTIMRGCLEGGQALHQKGWLHNDYKPDNILVSVENDAQNKFKVLSARIHDFGFASIVNNPEPDKARNRGTSGYFIRGQNKSLQSDIYGLGMTFAKFTKNCIGTGEIDPNLDINIEQDQKDRLTTLIFETRQAVQSMIEKMTSTTVEGMGRSITYNNKMLTFQSLLEDLTNIETHFMSQYTQIPGCSP